MTSLLKGKPAKLTWNQEAVKSFENLKTSFTTVPILKHPDPELPFVVEVDASDCGISAVLSQRHGNPGKLHPCAFFSCKLTAAERNYDVGNKELLSMKAAQRSGVTGWKEQFTPFKLSRTIRTLSISRAPGGKIPGRLAGHYFSLASILR